MDGFGIYTGTRAQYAPQPGLLNVSMDFNAAPNGNARGTEVVIPDNAGPEVRAAAERYNQMVADFARQQGIEDYPVRGVRTRSENQRGVPYTVHTEPFFNTDLDMQRAIQANPQEFAGIYQSAFGNIPNARLIAPHGVGNDRGAASEIFGDETSFGEFLASTALGQEYTPPQTQGGNMQRQPQGLLGNQTISTQGQAPQQAPAQEEERAPFFQRPGVANVFDTLAMGLEGMTLNPNQALIKGAQQRIQQRREMGQMEQQRNRTADWLESQGLADLAQGVRSGALGARDALTMARGNQQDPYSNIGKLQADLAAGRINQEQYEVALQSMAPSNTSIEVGPDGQLRFAQGPGAEAKPFTEGQSKDVVYATRAEGALQVLDPVADNLADAASRAANVDPTGFIRSRLQSPEFQVAQQAGNEFLQAILRKDTGAAITADEQQLYGQTYLPQPGDSPEVLREKKAARRRALNAIRGGMSPSQIIAVEQNVATEPRGQSNIPKAGATSGNRIRYDAEGNRIND